MSLIVQKFGGSSVANAERVFNVARIITDTYKQGNDVVVVVSAQGDTTDDLIEKANEINPNASKREKDMLLASGEQISIALLAMAIEKLGFPVISLLGWQAGFQTTSAYTSARIKRVRTDRIAKELDKKNIVIVAGFQGINRYEDVTTLGRGGSDTSAVAIAAAMHADICQIFTDVEGVYTADPRKVPNARKLQTISFSDIRFPFCRAGRLSENPAHGFALSISFASVSDAAYTRIGSFQPWALIRIQRKSEGMVPMLGGCFVRSNARVRGCGSTQQRG